MFENLTARLARTVDSLRGRGRITEQGDGKKQGRKGFTLVELLVVIAILGALVTMAIPLYSEVTNSVKVSRCKAEIYVIAREISAYAIDNQGALPPGLGSISMKVAHLKDPWDRDYEYSTTPAYQGSGASLLNTDYDLYSKGLNGLSGTPPDVSDDVSKDDIVRSNDGGWVGMVKEVWPP